MSRRVYCTNNSKYSIEDYQAHQAGLKQRITSEDNPLSIKESSTHQFEDYQVRIFSAQPVNKNHWSFSYYQIYHQDQLITTIYRNDSHQFIKFLNHPNGKTYLFLSEHYNGGLTIFDLNDRIEYIYLPNEWCITNLEIVNRTPQPSEGLSGQNPTPLLILTTCFWGGPYGTKFYDFGSPPDRQSFRLPHEAVLRTADQTEPDSVASEVFQTALQNNNEFNAPLKICSELTPAESFIFDRIENGLIYFKYAYDDCGESGAKFIRESFDVFNDQVPNLQIVYETDPDYKESDCLDYDCRETNHELCKICYNLEYSITI